MGTKDQESTEPVMTVIDVARSGEVASETVRLWERLGKLKARRTASGIRLFEPADVARFLANRRARVKRGSNG